LQRTTGYADDFGNLFSGLSPLYEIGDLANSIRRKLCWSSATSELRDLLNIRMHVPARLIAVHALVTGDAVLDCGFLRHGHFVVTFR